MLPGMGMPLDVEGPVTAEVFTVARDGDQLVLTGPCGPAPWLIEAGGGEHPLDTVRRIVENSIPDPILLHSTSWRFERGAVYLSFVTVIDSGRIGDMGSATITRSDLARNTTHAAPEAIAHGQVLEHGLRHLAWLATEDDTVRAALDDGWHHILDGYVPEPFRQLDEGERR